MIKLNKTAVKRETNASDYLPWSSHITADLIRTSNNDLVGMFKVEGMAFETIDFAQFNAWHDQYNRALRSVLDNRLAIYSYVVRRKYTGFPGGVFKSNFASELNKSYEHRVMGDTMYINELYLAVVYRDSVGKGDKVAKSLASLLMKKSDNDKHGDTDRINKINDTINDLMHFFEKHEVRRLKLYESNNGLVFSELLEAMHLVLYGEKRKVPLTRGLLSSALTPYRLIFGDETIEVRTESSTKYAGIMSVLEYPSSTFSGVFNGLLNIDTEFVLSQSFTFKSKAEGIELARVKHAQMNSADDVAVSQTDELIDAMDDVQSGKILIGEHNLSVMAFGKNIKFLNDNLAKLKVALSSGAITMAREDLALEAAYWSQVAGNFEFRTRPSNITSKNFCAFAPFYNYPVGKLKNNHWGNAICMFRTQGQSPYFFNLHRGDIGHTLIIGPSGGGKTVLQNFILANSDKAGARQIFIDKDRGAEIFVRACGGNYLALKNGVSTGFAPLKALVDTPDNRAFLIKWLTILVCPNDEKLTPVEQKELSNALDAVFALSQEKRTLGAIESMLDQTQENGMKARLERWLNGNELGWVFDNPTDTLDISRQFAGFDMTDFLDNDVVRPSLMSYLFHRIGEAVNGEPLIVDIDEFWKALSDDYFKDFIQDALKTFRKGNAVMLFGTQSPADALKSEISHSILEQCVTKILLPNPMANKKDYIDGLGLTLAEFELIKTGLTPESRKFLVKQDNTSVVAELNLRGMDNEISVLSARASTIALVDRLRAEYGDDPNIWLPHFYEQSTGLT